MGGRLALIAILLAGSVGGLYLVVRSIIEDRTALNAVADPGGDEADWEAARGLPEGRRRKPVETEQPPVEEKPAPEDVEPVDSGTPISPPEITTDYADLVLELARPKEEEERSILVKVTDTEGEPLEDVLVVVRDQGAVIYRERTDESGAVEYEPYADEEGPFRIDAIAGFYSPGALPRCPSSVRGSSPTSDAAAAPTWTPWRS